MSTKFYFLENKYSKLYLISKSAEILSFIDTGACLSKCRIFIEELINLVSKFEKVTYPESTDLGTKIYKLKSTNILPDGANKLLHSIRNNGNKGAHRHFEQLDNKISHSTLKECYQLALWFIYTYEQDYIEDKKYENLNNFQVLVGKAAHKPVIMNAVFKANRATGSLDDVDALERDIIKAPSYMGSVESKIIELNDDVDKVKDRREKSQKYFKSSLGIFSLVSLTFSPITAVPAIAAGILGGIGLMKKHKNTKKDN